MIKTEITDIKAKNEPAAQTFFIFSEEVRKIFEAATRRKRSWDKKRFIKDNLGRIMRAYMIKEICVLVKTPGKEVEIVFTRIKLATQEMVGTYVIHRKGGQLPLSAEYDQDFSKM